MHRFLKYLLLVTFICGIFLPWALSNLGKVSLTMDGTERAMHSASLGKMEAAEVKVVIGIVACGQQALLDTITLLKSVILSSIYHGLSSLDAIIFADDEHLYAMDVKVGEVKNLAKGLQFRYEIHPVIFPAKNHDEWKHMFRPCASQRLFLHAALPHINEILYLDVDTLVIGDLRNIWTKFKEMSFKQAVGLAIEQEKPSIGWYDRFAKHPYYPPLGLNSGVMLMNLTRLRTDFEWENDILSYYKKYKDNIVYGDQDLLNIIFYHRPDAVYLLPCSFNYRTDHCQYGLNCKPAEKHPGGIQIVHGSRNVFHDGSHFPTFKNLYKYYLQFDLSKDDFIQHIVAPFKKELCNYHHKLDKPNVTLTCDNTCNLFFKNFIV